MKSDNGNIPLNQSKAAIANGVTMAGGTMGRLDSDGDVQKATSGYSIFGALSFKGSATGDGVEEYFWDIEDGAIFEVDYGNLTAAQRAPGQLVDLNTAATGITTNSNGDFLVVPDNGMAREGKIWVKPVNRQAS